MNKKEALRLLKDLNMSINDDGIIQEIDFFIILQNYLKIDDEKTESLQTQITELENKFRKHIQNEYAHNL